MLLPGYVHKVMHGEFSLVFPVNRSVPETDCITGQFVLFIEVLEAVCHARFKITLKYFLNRRKYCKRASLAPADLLFVKQTEAAFHHCLPPIFNIPGIAHQHIP